MNKFICIIFSTILFSCSHPTYKNPHVVIVTNFGDIEAELFPSQAPKTVASFLSYIDSGFYNNSSFYRVVMQEGFSANANTGIIQGGIYLTNDKQHPDVPGIMHESTKQSGLSHTSGTLSLARTTPGTGSTEFFICIGDQSQFDFGNGSSADTAGFAAFGRVVNGMETVRKIQVQPKHGESLDNKVVIKKIERL